MGSGMIAVDTNALFRWLLADILPPEDAAQTAAIGTALDDGGNPVFLSTVVMAELVWLLRSRLRLDRGQIAAILQSILTDPRIVVQQAKAFVAATAAFARGGPGFVDHLIGQIALTEGARTTLTFDKGAARLSTFTLLARGG